MDWIRGGTLGHGSFAKVSLAVPRSQSSKLPPLMAVKSCGVSLSSSLMSEGVILEELKGCPEIIRCFGEGFSYENGDKINWESKFKVVDQKSQKGKLIEGRREYNILLEYASGGSLADKLKTSGDRRLREYEVRRYAKALLRGLNYIHKFGYVHCDLKRENILLCQNDVVKIADFGLARKAVQRAGKCIRGTPLYMSPEMVAGGDQGAAADIWALGCAVGEMLTGSTAWPYTDVAGLLMKIGAGDELPEIPEYLSEKAKFFLEKCFVKDPSKRWTAEMLLDHPFIHEQDYEGECTIVENIVSTSPNCPFDFPDRWVSPAACSVNPMPPPERQLESASCWSAAAAGRLVELVTNQSPDWSVSDDWVIIR
ncbi:hypothetical protein OROGR_023621 [Orobanche gracilis]